MSPTPFARKPVENLLASKSFAIVGGTKTPGYNYYRAAIKTAIKFFHDYVAFIVPGKITCGELVDYYAMLTEKKGDAERGRHYAGHTKGRGMQPSMKSQVAISSSWRPGSKSKFLSLNFSI